MRRVWGVLLAAVVVVGGGAAASAGPGLSPKVVGGSPAPANFGFVGALIKAGSGSVASRQFCGGALIAPTWVVTAAHCAQELQLHPGGLVVLGRADLTASGGEEIGFKAVNRNPGWSQQSNAGDVALLELERPSTQTPVALATPATDPTVTSATVAGWGYTIATGGGQSSKLLSATLQVFSDDQCQQFVGPRFEALHHLCAGTAQASACNGDSGGPLLATDTKGRLAVIGVSSFGPRVCGQGPSVYTQLAGYDDYLTSIMGPTTTPSPTTTAPPAPPAARAPGYSILAADGTVYSFGAAPGRGSAGACRGPRSCTDIAGPAGGGYWVSRGSCELSAFGPVAVVASPPTDERCTLAAAPSGKGVWALTPSGRVFALGAPSYGNGANRPKLAWQQIEPRPQGDGYWLLGSDGAVAGFGVAKAAAASGGQALGQVVGMAATPAGTGYWLVAKDGAVRSFGAARFFGSTAGRKLKAAVMGIQATPSGAGYWLFGADGAVYPFGDAKPLGSPVGKPGPMVAALRR